MNTVLVIVDIQNDYFEGGANPLVGSFEASLNAQKILENFRAKNLPVIHIQHISSRPGATFFLPGTHGAEMHINVRPSGSETVIEKHYPNSFRETSLLTCLSSNNITNLVVCGMMTHMCVDATARAAADMGFQIMVAEDACATMDLAYGDTLIPADHVHKAFLAALKTYGQVLPSEQILAKLAAEQARV